MKQEDYVRAAAYKAGIPNEPHLRDTSADRGVVF